MLDTIIQSFQQYYGLDWIIFAANILAVWLLGNKDRLGFVIRIGANLTWILLGTVINSLPLVLAGIIFSILNLRGFFKWKNSEKN